AGGVRMQPSPEARRECKSAQTPLPECVDRARDAGQKGISRPVETDNLDARGGQLLFVRQYQLAYCLRRTARGRRKRIDDMQYTHRGDWRLAGNQADGAPVISATSLVRLNSTGISMSSQNLL